MIHTGSRRRVCFLISAACFTGTSLLSTGCGGESDSAHGTVTPAEIEAKKAQRLRDLYPPAPKGKAKAKKGH